MEVSAGPSPPSAFHVSPKSSERYTPPYWAANTRSGAAGWDSRQLTVPPPSAPSARNQLLPASADRNKPWDVAASKSAPRAVTSHHSAPSVGGANRVHVRPWSADRAAPRGPTASIPPSAPACNLRTAPAMGLVTRSHFQAMAAGSNGVALTARRLGGGAKLRLLTGRFTATGAFATPGVPRKIPWVVETQRASGRGSSAATDCSRAGRR